VPRARAGKEEGVGVLTEPAVAPSGDVVEGAAEGGFGGRAGEEGKIVGGAGCSGEGGVSSGGEQADDSDFVVGVADEDGLRGVDVSGIELGTRWRRGRRD
jgi:hypothetical protein